ncbi:hypothetical protein [Spirosoma arcticum]
MESATNDELIRLLRAVLDDLKKIKDKLGIDQPIPPGGGAGGGGTGGGSGGTSPGSPPPQ